jgi:23S rRNA (pseudouridine1915-N3)-methyltransferase
MRLQPLRSLYAHAMLIRLLMLGKTRRPEIRALLDDYAARIRRFAELEMQELRQDSPAVRRSGRIEIAPGAAVVLLDAAGKQYSSEQFARWLGAARDHGTRQIAFLCGAAEGFPESVAKRATTKMSLSPLTFSHELARVMLAEQLYRALATLAGHPYPK